MSIFLRLRRNKTKGTPGIAFKAETAAGNDRTGACAGQGKQGQGSHMIDLQLWGVMCIMGA